MKHLILALFLLPAVASATELVEFTSNCGLRHTVVYPDSCPPCPCQGTSPVKTRVGRPAWAKTTKPAQPRDKRTLTEQVTPSKGVCK